MKKLLKKENKLIHKKENTYIKEKLSPITEKLNEKVPDKLMETLTVAFEKGFYYVFEKGTAVIEKGFDTEHLKNEYDVNQYALKKESSNRNLKRFDKKVRSSMMVNQGITTVEGTVLGLLGIGLPDIPIFIGMLIKNIYEICLSYGFTYQEKEEKVYILNIICMATVRGGERASYSKIIDEIGDQIDGSGREEEHLEDRIKEAAEKLSAKLVGAKFVQGLPIIGAVGGITNFAMMSEVGKVASIKYNKRFLKRMENAPK